MKSNKKEFIFLSLSPTGVGISGSDRIFIELSREWSKNFPVTIYTTQEGVDMCGRQKLSGKFLTINKVEKNNLPLNFFLNYLYKICISIRLGFALNKHNSKFIIHNSYLYSSSDFWMDVFPAVILKIRYPKLRWVATWFMTAPNPLKGFSESLREDKYRFSAFLYWFSQLPVKSLINMFADIVIVNNEDERRRFRKMNEEGRVSVLLGAVRLNEIKKFQFTYPHLLSIKNTDAVFQGRFHPQKGVVELINIWRKVVDKIPSAKLVMIGDGPLRKDVESRIWELGLEKNIKLLGYVFDGDKKYKIFSQSKIVVHPAFYDSGGMASAEAMAFGLPAVGFDLKAFKSYYPEGMEKAKDEKSFSRKVIKLLKDDRKRNKLGYKAKKMIEKKYSWEVRAKEIFSKIVNLI